MIQYWNKLSEHFYEIFIEIFISDIVETNSFLIYCSSILKIVIALCIIYHRKYYSKDYSLCGIEWFDKDVSDMKIDAELYQPFVIYGNVTLRRRQ